VIVDGFLVESRHCRLEFRVESVVEILCCHRAQFGQNSRVKREQVVGVGQQLRAQYRATVLFFMIVHGLAGIMLQLLPEVEEPRYQPDDTGLFCCQETENDREKTVCVRTP